MKTLLNILPSLNHRGCQPHWQPGELRTIYLYFINYKTIHALNSIKHIYTNPKVSLYLFSGHNKGSLIGSDKGEVFVLIFSCGKVWLSIIFGSICQYAKSMENLNHLIWKRGIFALCAKIEVFWLNNENICIYLFCRYFANMSALWTATRKRRIARRS